MKDLTKKLLIILISIFVITACDNNSTEPEDDSNNGHAITSISGTIQNWQDGEGYTVKLVVDTTFFKEIFIAGESTISVSGDFNISNLKDVPESFLGEFYDVFLDSLICDNPSARFSLYFSGLEVYDQNGNMAGFINQLYNGVESSKRSRYIYSNSDAKVTGRSTDNYMGMVRRISADIELKKGWNIYYVVTYFNEDDNSLRTNYTSELPDGLYWYFYDVK